MQGEKLFQAKQSVLKLVDHLAPGDRCGAVAFTTTVSVVSPALEMTPAAKAELKLRLGDLEATAQTNLSGGMLEGLGLANAPGLPDGMLVRVILFTDGLVEAEDESGEPFGMSRLEALLRVHRAHDLPALLGHVDAAARAHRGPFEAADDATMVALRFSGAIGEVRT